MEGLHRKVPDGADTSRIAAATDGRNRGKTMGRRERDGPRAEAAHTQARDRAPLWIYVVVLHDGIEERQEGLRGPGFPRGALRRDHDKRKIGLLLDDVGHAMALHPLQILAPFPRAMEKQQQRPALRMDGIRCREKQEVGERTSVRPGPSEGVGLLHTGMVHGVLLGRHETESAGGAARRLLIPYRHAR